MVAATDPAEEEVEAAAEEGEEVDELAMAVEEEEEGIDLAAVPDDELAEAVAAAAVEAAGEEEAEGEVLEENGEEANGVEAEGEDTEAVEKAAEEAAAAEADGAAAEEAEEDEELEGDVEVQEHLKDSVEGSLRLKRLLSRDDTEAGPGKKRRVSAEEAVRNKLLVKYGLSACCVTKHVLEGLNPAEIKALGESSWVPDKFNQRQGPGEQLSRFVSNMRERTLPSGGALDQIGAFKFRWKIKDMSKDALLRKLPHKDLRYVLANYNDETPLEDVIAEAKDSEPDVISTESTIPLAPGLNTMGRFTRLELIDPLADSAVFGDANLTFSVKLAKHRKALGHVGRVIATTFEELDTLKERYTEIEQSIKTLEDHYAEVYHGIDCTRIAVDSRFEGMEGSLGAVYYNFPHSGVVNGFFDGHPLVNWRHENLMRLFFRALRSFVKPGGSVKVASSAGAVGVRFSYIVSAALENEFKHIETMPFLDWHLHRYGRSYGDKRDTYKRPDAKNNQSYNAQNPHNDMVYCFIYEPSGEKLPKQTVRLPPTLKTLSACTEGPFNGLFGPAKNNLAKSLHQRFVTEISGTHVGT